MGYGGVKQSWQRKFLITSGQLDKICLHSAVHLGVLTAAVTVNAILAKLQSR